MIISQTPFRVSFAGGGTDLAAFYEKEYGAVLSVTLKRHMYVTVHTRFERNIRVSYSKTEIADSVEEINHELVREAMRMTNTIAPLEITTIADVPAGTGLGSSSTLTVGLLNALYAYNGQVASRATLAEQASVIEINRLGHPIGKQDQYAAAFGGVNYIRFNPDHTVEVHPVPSLADTRREIERCSLIVYTANQRSANEILTQQRRGTSEKIAVLRAMRDMASEMRDLIISRRDLDELGKLLHEGWQLKRSLGFGISNSQIDEWYAAARKAGAIGGKLLGAGGSGFIYLMAPPETHARILDKLGHPQTLAVELDPFGSRIAFISD